MIVMGCSEVDRGGARGAMAPPIIVPRPGNPEQVTNTLLWSPRVVSGAKILQKFEIRGLSSAPSLFLF